MSLLTPPRPTPGDLERAALFSALQRISLACEFDDQYHESRNRRMVAGWAMQQSLSAAVPGSPKYRRTMRALALILDPSLER